MKSYIWASLVLLSVGVRWTWETGKNWNLSFLQGGLFDFLTKNNTNPYLKEKLFSRRKWKWFLRCTVRTSKNLLIFFVFIQSGKVPKVRGWPYNHGIVQLIPSYLILITFLFSFLSLDLRSVLCPLAGLVPTGSGFGKHLILGLCSCISGSSQF